MAINRSKTDHKPMIKILNENRFDYMTDNDKAFVLAFNDEMKRLGYDFGGEIGSGFCWGKYMIVYRKLGVKSKKVFARIYMRDASIVLRLFFSKIDEHREYIENAPPYIKQVFTGDSANCNHCDNERVGRCRFRKVYTLEERKIEKCNGNTLRFEKPEISRIVDYIDLFTEFYPNHKKIKTSCS